MFRFAQHDKLQISSRSLLALDGFEQRFEIAFAEALCAFALNNFKEERRAILYRLRENLEQITFIIAIDQDTELFQRIQFLVNMTHAVEQRVVVSRRYFQELEPTILKIGNS